MIEIAPRATGRAGPVLGLIDNYDSFTFNLVQALASLGARCLVFKNDEINSGDLANLPLHGLVLSPGPARPEQAGVTLGAIHALSERLPVLGVCLGHQAIAQAFGGNVVCARQPLHGKVCSVEHPAQGLFAGLPQPLRMARYNSLTVELQTLPACLEVLAYSAGEIMALRHRERHVYGVQFHPESVLSEGGIPLLENWLRYCERD